MTPGSRLSRGARGGRSLGSGGGGGANRRVRISKAMSWLLRHGAYKEGIHMDEQGYVNVADLLNWHKIQKELSATFEDVMEEVRSNEKQRFALLYMPPTDDTTSSIKNGNRQKDGGADMSEHTDLEEATTTTIIPKSSTPTTIATATALSHAFSTTTTTATTTNPSHFLIRATQGHSIRTIVASTYLTPVVPHSLPSTVVHGTFHFAWPAILKTRGLKPMSRVHVHFAQGPSLSSVLNDSTTGGMKEASIGAAEEERDARVLETEGGERKEEVISGMRSDAQILIYINLSKALDMGIPFWMSENGVVLSEGAESKIEGRNKKMSKVRLVPTDCWDVVVEVEEGLGVIWRSGEGPVKEVPGRLLGRERRKKEMNGGGGGGGKKNKSKPAGGGGKPRLMVERDDDEELR